MSERTPEEILRDIEADEKQGLTVFEIMNRFRCDGSCKGLLRERLNDLPAMARRVQELEARLPLLDQRIVRVDAERDKLAAQVEEAQSDYSEALGGIHELSQEVLVLRKELAEAKEHNYKLACSLSCVIAARTEEEHRVTKDRARKLLNPEPGGEGK